MTTSSSFEILILAEQGVLYRHSVDALAVPHVVVDLLPMDAAEPFAVVVRRSSPDASRLRLRLGTETIAQTPGGSAECATGLQAWLRDEFGESRIVVEREAEAGADRFETLFEQGIAVSPRPEVARDFRVMIEDLAEVHQGLAQDVVGRSMLRGGQLGGPVALLYPETLVGRLETLLSRLEHSLAHIARQPSVVLDRTMRQDHYRGGSRTDARSVSAAARDPRTRPRCGWTDCLAWEGRTAGHGGQRGFTGASPHRRWPASLVAASRVACRTLRASRRLAPSRGSPLGSSRPWPTIRIRAARPASSSGVARAVRTRTQFGRRISSSLGSTPFSCRSRIAAHAVRPNARLLGRAAYREVYRALLEARQFLGVLVDADEARLVHRNLADLYEYWCFLRTVAHLRDRFGAAGARQSFSLIDDIYRPELSPGQEFRFALGGGTIVTATYQPEFHPWRDAEARRDRYGASLTSNPLRPDITLEVAPPLRPPVVLVLDAKSTDAFSTIKLRDMTDYARQVFELETNRQPIRQVFLLHRDREARTLSNLPGYLRGKRVDRHAMVLGAVPCVPERVGFTPPLLALVIDRFLEVFVGMPGDCHNMET